MLTLHAPRSSENCTKATVVGPLAPEFSVDVVDFSDGSARIKKKNNIK